MYLAQFVMGAALPASSSIPGHRVLAPRHRAPARLDLGALRNGVQSAEAGDYKTAVVHLEIVSSRLPDFAEAHSLLAQAYDHLGRAEDAKRERSRSEAKKALIDHPRQASPYQAVLILSAIL